MVLDIDPAREGATPRDAATLVMVREARGGGIEVFCVERHKASGFLGGAVVFPGGKLDERDRDAEWLDVVTAPIAPRTPIAPDDESLRALAIAACREALEEAALLPLAGGEVAHVELVSLRDRIAHGETDLRAFLASRGLRLDLAALRPFARWITPAAESRRFDARFFLAIAGDSQLGAHDERETMASFWASPAEVLRRFDARELQLAPPTHRSLEVLAGARSCADAMAVAAAACLDPICPRLVAHRDASGDTLALTLPGDPELDVREPRVPGRPRFVLRDGRWLPEDPPQ
jgi:8-oxo-dGTP pyrophosphatase MutT (NUDIX family)